MTRNSVILDNSKRKRRCMRELGVGGWEGGGEDEIYDATGLSDTTEYYHYHRGG